MVTTEDVGDKNDDDTESTSSKSLTPQSTAPLSATPKTPLSQSTSSQPPLSQPPLSQPTPSRPSRIRIAESAWSEREFVGHILARYFILKEDLGGPLPAWKVQPKEKIENGDVHFALELANEDLFEVNQMAELFSDEPWAIQVLNRPDGQFSIGKNIMLLFWLGSFLSTFLIGSSWVSSTSGGEITDTKVLLSGLLFYAIPFVGTLAIASNLQVFIGKKLGVRLGHILPVPFPIPYFTWPFGVLFAPSHPKMDSIIWPNRRSLALSAIPAPLVLVTSGLVFIFLGLYLTPENTVISQQPTRISFPLIASLTASAFLGPDSMQMLSAWAHPFTLAGLGLMMLGWVYLIPIPGFPGNRLFVSLTGLETSRSFSSQISFFLMVAVTGLMFGGIGGHGFWSFITIYGCLQILILGSNLSIPRILDDHKPLDEKTSKRISHMLFVVLLLALPSEIPTELVTDWDSTPEWSIPSEVEAELNESGDFYMLLDSNALLSTDWSIRGWTNNTDWQFRWDCPSGANNPLNYGCHGAISPLSQLKISLDWDSPRELYFSAETVELHLWLQSGDSSKVETIRLIPNSQVILNDAFWNWNHDYESPQLCSSLLFAENALSGNLSVIDSASDGLTAEEPRTWTLSEASNSAITPENLENGVAPFCVNGEAGESFHLNEQFGVRWVSDEGEVFNFHPSLPLSSNTLSSSADFTLLAEETLQFTAGSNVFWAEEYTFCSDNNFPRLPGVSDENGTGGMVEWRWDMLFRANGLVPDLTNGSLNLSIPDYGWLMACGDSPIPLNSWKITPTIAEYSLSSLNGQLLEKVESSGSQDSEIYLNSSLQVEDVQLRTHGDVDINVEISNNSYTVLVNHRSGQVESTSIWLQLDSEGVLELHVSSWVIGG